MDQGRGRMHTPMDYDSISYSDLDAVTLIANPPPTNDTETTRQVGVRAGPWRVAHTLQNQDKVKIESPTAPALIFW